ALVIQTAFPDSPSRLAVLDHDVQPVVVGAVARLPANAAALRRGTRQRFSLRLSAVVRPPHGVATAHTVPADSVHAPGGSSQSQRFDAPGLHLARLAVTGPRRGRRFRAEPR